MRVAVGDRSFNLTWKGLMVLFGVIGAVIAALTWFRDTSESNKVVPLLEAEIGYLTVEVKAREEDIAENVEAIEWLAEEVEELGDEQSVMGTNLILLMRELDVEPVEP